MTVVNEQSSQDFIGNGIDAAFTFTIQSFDPVWMFGRVEGLLVGGSAQLNGDQEANPGGIFTFTEIPPLDSEVRVFRNVDLTQLVDFPPFGAFPARNNEDALDKAIMALAQMFNRFENVVIEGDVEFEGGITLPNNRAITFANVNDSIDPNELGIYRIVNVLTDEWLFQTTDGAGGFDDLFLVTATGIEFPNGAFTSVVPTDPDELTNKAFVDIADAFLQDQINDIDAVLPGLVAQVAQNVLDIAQNVLDIADNTGDIATNTGDIATNTAGISANFNGIQVNAFNITNNSSAIDTNFANIATNTLDISDNASDINVNSIIIGQNTDAIDLRLPLDGTLAMNGELVLNGAEPIVGDAAVSLQFVTDLVEGILGGLTFLGAFDAGPGDLPSDIIQGGFYIISGAGNLLLSTGGAVPVATDVFVGDRIVFNEDGPFWLFFANITGNALSIEFDSGPPLNYTTTNVQDALAEADQRMFVHAADDIDEDINGVKSFLDDMIMRNDQNIHFMDLGNILPDDAGNVRIGMGAGGAWNIQKRIAGLWEVVLQIAPTDPDRITFPTPPLSSAPATINNHLMRFAETVRLQGTQTIDDVKTFTAQIQTTVGVVATPAIRPSTDATVGIDFNAGRVRFTVDSAQAALVDPIGATQPLTDASIVTRQKGDVRYTQQAQVDQSIDDHNTDPGRHTTQFADKAELEGSGTQEFFCADSTELLGAQNGQQVQLNIAFLITQHDEAAGRHIAQFDAKGGLATNNNWSANNFFGGGVETRAGNIVDPSLYPIFNSAVVGIDFEGMGIRFKRDSVAAAIIDLAGTALAGATSIVTQQKGDFRYARWHATEAEAAGFNDDLIHFADEGS